jgi:hypothetical protein
MDSFEYLSVSHLLEVVDGGSANFKSEHRFELKAVNPARFFVRNYWWTGSGSDDSLPELISEIDQWGFFRHRIHGPMIVENTSRIVVVDLGRRLQPGETEVVQFKHRMKDLDGTFQPYLRVGPDTVASKVALTVILPESLSREVYYEVADGVSGQATEVDKMTGTVLDQRRRSFERSFEKLTARKSVHLIRWSKQVSVPRD